MRVLIVCALLEEARPIIHTLRLKSTSGTGVSFEGKYHSHALQLIVTGPGKINAIKGCESVFSLQKSDMIIVAGFAGGLDAQFKAGDLFIAEKIILWEKEEMTVNPQIQNVLDFWKKENIEFIHDRLKNIPKVILLTAFRVISKSDDKRRIGCRFHAQAVDLESGWIFQKARQLSMPVLIIKGITDAVDETLEIDFSGWIGTQGETRKWHVFLQIFRRPGQIKSLIRLARTSRKVGRSLVEVIKRVLTIDE